MIRKGKLFFIVALIISAFFSLILRLASLQIVKGDIFAEDAENLHNTTIKIRPERGQIFDRSGNPLALNVPCYSIFWRRTCDVIEKEKLKKLFTVVGKDWLHIEGKIDRGAKFIYLNRSADEEILDTIKKNLAIGIEWKEGKKRIYPCGEIASHILGFVGTDRGLEGIERD